MRLYPFLVAAIAATLALATPAAAQTQSLTATVTNGVLVKASNPTAIGLEYYAPAFSGLAPPNFNGNNELVIVWPRQTGKSDNRLIGVKVTLSDGTVTSTSSASWRAREPKSTMGASYSPSYDGSAASIVRIDVQSKRFKPSKDIGSNCEKKPFIVRLEPRTMRPAGDTKSKRNVDYHAVQGKIKIDGVLKEIVGFSASTNAKKYRFCRLVQVVAGQAVSSTDKAKILFANHLSLYQRSVIGIHNQAPHLVATWAEVAVIAQRRGSGK